MRIIRKTMVGSYAIIIRDEKIALIKKAYGASIGKYDLPGGEIEHNEEPIDALYRECKEELEATVLKATLWDAISVPVDWKINKDLQEDLQRIAILYKTEIKEDRIRRSGDSIDSDGASFVPISKLTEENTSSLLWHTLEKIKTKNKK